MYHRFVQRARQDHAETADRKLPVTRQKRSGTAASLLTHARDADTLEPAAVRLTPGNAVRTLGTTPRPASQKRQRQPRPNRRKHLR
jgi:hypothetical protein